MIKKIIFRGLFILFFFIFFVIYLAPADKIFSFVDLPKNVKLYSIKGDLWEGHIDTIDIDDYRVKNVRWELDFFTLVFARGITIGIRDDKLAKGTFGLNVFDLDKELYLSRVDLKSNIANLLPYLKLPFPVKADGLIQTDIAHLAIKKNGDLKSINGKIVIRDAFLVHPFDPDLEIDLGKISMNIENPRGNVEKIEVNLEQESSMFKTQRMKITITNLKDIEVDGVIKPKGSMPESLVNLITMFGKPDADGNVRISYKGTI